MYGFYSSMLRRVRYCHGKSSVSLSVCDDEVFFMIIQIALIQKNNYVYREARVFAFVSL